MIKLNSYLALPENSPILKSEPCSVSGHERGTKRFNEDRCVKCGKPWSSELEKNQK